MAKLFWRLDRSAITSRQFGDRQHFDSPSDRGDKQCVVQVYVVCESAGSWNKQALTDSWRGAPHYFMILLLCAGKEGEFALVNVSLFFIIYMAGVLVYEGLRGWFSGVPQEWGWDGWMVAQKPARVFVVDVFVERVMVPFLLSPSPVIYVVRKAGSRF